MSEILAVSGCENVERIGDVVFVHGLGGDARGTWHPQGKRDGDNDSWPAWLGQELKNVGIWTLQYEVAPFAWKGTTMPLADRATNILTLLEVHDFGPRPIVFITHSLGGLLVKQMLRHARDLGSPEWKDIARQFRGIVFLSTPHSGSDLANWVKYLGTILQASVSVDELRANAARLRELNLWFRNNFQLFGTSIQAYCEKQKTKGILVVDETSADPGISGVIPVPMDANHISICRPDSQQSLIYMRSKRFISKRFKETTSD